MILFMVGYNLFSNEIKNTSAGGKEVKRTEYTCRKLHSFIYSYAIIEIVYCFVHIGLNYMHVRLSRDCLI